MSTALENPTRTAPPSGRRRSDLGIVTAMLAIPRSRLLAAVAAAVATLGSAFALAAVSAWLVTTAWTMPPVLDLSVAVVSVRALGISRGVFRWVERMTTHDAALCGVVNLRTGLFSALARRDDDALTRLRRGDLLARLGDDAQEIGDHVIRAVIPTLAAAVMAAAVLVVIAPLSGWAAAAMLLALVIACVLAPIASYRAAQISQAAVIAERSEVTAGALEILDDATSLRLDGRLDAALHAQSGTQARYDGAIDQAAWPSALAAAAIPAATLVALIGSVLAAGPLWLSDARSAGAIGILLLLPLSSFEAAGTLGPAAAQLARSRAAARRLVEAMGGGDPVAAAPADTTVDATAASPSRTDRAGGEGGHRLQAHGLSVGWSESSPRVQDLDLTIAPGTRMAIIGPSGRGKSTLLLTLAGLLAPLKGSVELDGTDLRDLDEAQIRAAVVMYAEDAHVFATTVRENLRVARGDASDDQIREALAAVGLEDWIAHLPGGLDHLLGPDGTTVSGGERRRLLLARALLRRAPISLIDEPTEHLDPERAGALLAALMDPGPEGLLPPESAVVVVTHQVDALPEGTCVLDLAAID